MKNPRRGKFFWCLLLSIFLYLGSSSVLFAGVYLSEIMYDVSGTDTDREWVEICTDVSVDLTAIKLFEANTNHSITESSGGATLSPGECAIVADKPDSFRADWGSYAGKVFDSVFSLSNSGETLSLKDGDAVLDTVSYTSGIGAAGDGNTLQKIDGSWVAGTPSVGAVNSGSDVATPEETVGETATTTETEDDEPMVVTRTVTRTVYLDLSTHSSPNELSTYDGTGATFVLGAGRDRLVQVGNPVLFDAEYKLTSACSGISKFDWTFGDGGSEMGERVSHAYLYPGEYVVVVNAYCGLENEVSRTNVRVVENKIEIGVLPDGGITMANNGLYEANLSHWVLTGAGSSYKLPKDTIIKKGSKIVIPYSISGVVPVSLDLATTSLVLVNPALQVVATWSAGSVLAVEAPQPLSIVQTVPEVVDVVAPVDLTPEPPVYYGVASVLQPLDGEGPVDLATETHTTTVETVLLEPELPPPPTIWQVIFSLPKNIFNKFY